MARVTEKRLPQSPTTAADVVDIESDRNPLIWRVPARARVQSYLVDLTPFATGDSPSGTVAKPALIHQLAPELRLTSFRLLEGPMKTCLYHVRVFWRFLEVIEKHGGGVLDDLSVITPAIGVMFKNFMLNELRLAPSTARKCLKSVQGLSESARERLGLFPSKIIWPTVQSPRGTVSKDVDPEALRRLYNTAKGVVRRFAAAYQEGKLLPEQGSDPRRECQRASSPAWKLIENVAWITRDCLRKILAEPGVKLEDILPDSLMRRRTKCRLLPKGYEDGQSFDRLRWYAPLAEDVAAAVTLVLLHTGWNVETVFAIDVSTLDAWCQERLASEVGETVAIYGNKGRTNREQIAFSLTRPQFHPYRVIKDMIECTEELRSSLRERLISLESEAPSPESQDDILRLQHAISSPWLFLRKTGGSDIFGRVGVLNQWAGGGTFSPVFEALVRSAGIEDKLTPSDLRDGFASFLYGNSLFNIFLVKRALGHRNLSSTKHYLRQRRMLAQRFADYTIWSDSLFDEIRRFQTVDPTILYIQARFGDVTEEQRLRLSDYRLRTRMGMGCLDPFNPPDTVAPMHEKGCCTVHRCTLCRHGVVFRESFQPLANRVGELKVIRGRTPLERWGGSSFQAEWIAIEATISRVFPGRESEFEEMVDAHVERLRIGNAYLFEEVGAGDLHAGLAA